MITNEQIKKHLSSLKPHTMSSARRNQKYRVPFIVENLADVDHTSTHDESFKVKTKEAKKNINIHLDTQYRFDGKWFSYRNFAYNSKDPRDDENFIILKVENLPLSTFTNRVNKKSFIGRIDKLVFQGLIEPFMLFIDSKFVNWDNIEIVYDCDDTWIIVRGKKYFYEELKYSTFNLVIMPFKCEFLGDEPDYLFDLNYRALCEYIQESSYVRDGNLYILSPTMDTEYEYNHAMFNVGGWLYSQIKRYGIGALSEDRANKLRYITVYASENNNSIATRYDALDKDVPTNNALYEQLVFMPIEKYYSYPALIFDEYGLQSENGGYRIVILDDNIVYKYDVSSEDKILYNLSDIDNILFRENYLVFEDGYFKPWYPLMTSINNVTLCDNPDKHEINIKVIYNKLTDHVIRNSDVFIKNYMNDKARIYLQFLYHTSYEKRIGFDAVTFEKRTYDNNGKLVDKINEDRVIRNIDAKDTVQESNKNPTGNIMKLTQDGDIVEILRRTVPFVEAYPNDEFTVVDKDPLIYNKDLDINKKYLYNTGDDGIHWYYYDDSKKHHKWIDGGIADVGKTGGILKNLDIYYLDMEFAFVPSITEYAVYLNDYENDAVELLNKAMNPLDFDYDFNNDYDDNVNNAVESIVKYNPSLLNPIYHKFVDQMIFTGTQANESLLYEFMYESRYGLKIPRKKYNNHETYVMVFVNGVLIENYYKMIAYANFFFIPLEDGFKFNILDRIEIVYFKNINNNEIQFRVDSYISEDNIDTLNIDINGGYKYIMDASKLSINSQNRNFLNANIFKPFIRPKELCIFSYYPKNMLKYPTLITGPEDDRVFNISYRDNSGNLCIKMDSISHITNEDSLDELNNKEKRYAKYMVATSKHKFIYQRLYVDKKAYRIKIDDRFKFCDVQSQYVLFVNGRRMKQDSFLITIPKHTRPFTDMYLYTARFVGPEDRVELFYLPYAMYDVNVDSSAELKENGYIQINKTKLNIPLSKDLYMIFINGKKIPHTDILDVDSHTIRLLVNPNTTNHVMMTAINVDTINEVENYLKDDSIISEYDSLMNYIKRYNSNPWDELDKALGCQIKMTNGEDDKVWANVAKIAILNEIVRDFWVTSGYDYQSQLFVYDYEEDELYERTDDDTLILPTLDANPEINIIKNDISLLYFYTEPANLLYEAGDRTDIIKFMWEYSQRLNQDWHILSQSINGVEIDVDTREYEIQEDISNESRQYKFISNTGNGYLVHDMYLDFVNGIYWGNIDEDELQYYNSKRMVQNMDYLIAVIPKDGIIPTVKIQEESSGSRVLNEYTKENNYITWDLTYQDAYAQTGDPYALIEIDVPSSYHGYFDDRDLPRLINRLDKHLLRTPNIKLNDYVIGNNNYFVFACPKRLVYDKHTWLAEFFFPDPNGEDIVANCRDDKVTPIYTDGEFDPRVKLLNKLYEMKMVYMGECEFTNKFGFTESYVVWRTNGFFTRLFENYGIDIRIKIGDFSNITVNFINNSQEVNVINYVNGIEVVEVVDISELDEHTKNAIERETTTMDTAKSANTVPTDNAASMKKTTRVIKSSSNDPADGAVNKPNTIDMGGNYDESKIKEMLDQGIFLI